MAERPVDTREVPEGYELVATPDPDWRPVSGKRCRFTSNRQNCGQPSVAEFDRAAQYGEGHRENWWAYCPAHTYGRWVEDGQVMHWILREQLVPADAVQRAAEVMLRQYDSQYSAGHLTWRDFADDAREILTAALLPGSGQ